MTRDAQDSSPVQDLLYRKETGAGPLPPRAMEHLALAIMIDSGMDMAEALAGLSRLRHDFVDWNEIRVARVQELARSIGFSAESERASRTIRDEYNAFFDKKGALNFDFLAMGKPVEMRRALTQLMPRLSKPAVALMLYEFCPGASLPLSDDGLKHARKDGVVGKSGDRNAVARALTESLEPADAALLLQHWELEGTGSPYGEALKRESAHSKKTRKAASKAKAAVKK
ncbi:MAG: hypothetical protein LUC93_11065 [Planctomycetaceae bacterium]|nr:hypothetical protein [Planctomycetaceae bacterium]